MKKVLINGAFGKMGQACISAIGDSNDLELVATLGKQDNLAAALEQLHPDIAIDFTTPQSVYENTLAIINAKVHPVIGTTGLTPQQIQALQTLSEKQKLGGVIAPNFSIGALLLMKMAAMATPYFPDAEIIELHHPQKKDAPSGTAIKTRELMQQAQHPSRDIPIHSVRLPGHIAHQMVIFGGHNESLTLRHDTLDRSCFMPGVIAACRKVQNLSNLVYGLENLLFE